MAPFANQVVEIYKVSLFKVNSIALTGTLTGLFFSMPTNYLMDNYGMKISLILNGIMVILGVFVSLFLNTNFTYLIVGNLVAGIGRNVILSGGPKTSSQWFLPKNTALITALFTTTYPLGVIAGY